MRSSEIEETLIYLTDIAGPRLTGSPGYRRAAEWARKSLDGWGLQEARLEEWDGFGRGWDYHLCRVEITRPYYSSLIAYPLGWTRGLPNPVQGPPILVEVSSEEDFDQYRGKLSGSIVLLGRTDARGPLFEADARRLSDEELVQIQEAGVGRRRPDEDRRREYRARREQRRKLREFLEEEGVAVVLEAGRGNSGTVFVGSGGSWKQNESLGFPSVVVAAEQYGRLLRILDRKEELELRVEVETDVFEDQARQVNVVAEIPGRDPALSEQVVLLGAHLDSWHGGTGATDNAAGCAVVMEAVRLLKELDLETRRTVRVVLWGGEELGLLGSRAYVKQHYGDVEKREWSNAHSKVSAYYNYDNGAGRIRGVYLQGHDAVRPIFADFIEPIRDLGVTALTIRNTGGTDHLSFDAAGLPAFQFIQDPMAYSTRTHHSNMDVFEEVVVDDLRQSAVVIAWFVYCTAMREELLPRKPLGEPGVRNAW